MSEVKPALRIRANASENVKGLVSCEATAEIIKTTDRYIDAKEALDMEDGVANIIEQTLSKLHKVLRAKGHKLAVDGGA
jgi:hypothetical protein